MSKSFFKASKPTARRGDKTVHDDCENVWFDKDVVFKVMRDEQQKNTEEKVGVGGHGKAKASTEDHNAADLAKFLKSYDTHDFTQYPG